MAADSIELRRSPPPVRVLVVLFVVTERFIEA